MIAPRTLLLSLAVSAALAGCATPGANPAADIRVPAAWGQTSAPTEAQPLEVTAPPADIAADGWWRGFNNAQLDALIDQVLASNTDLAVAGLRLQRARLQAGSGQCRPVAQRQRFARGVRQPPHRQRR
jgi:Outer membrane protein